MCRAQAEVVEDAAGHDRVSNEGDDLHPALAERALHHVDSERPAEQGRPIEAAVAKSRRSGFWRREQRVDGRGARHDPGAILGVGREDAMAANQMNSRRGNQRGEPGEELDGSERKMVGAVGEGTLEAVRDAATRALAELLVALLARRQAPRRFR